MTLSFAIRLRDEDESRAKSSRERFERDVRYRGPFSRSQNLRFAANRSDVRGKAARKAGIENDNDG